MLLDKAEHRVARIERSGPPRRELTTKSEQHVAGPIVSVAGEKPHSRSVAAHEHAEAVVFDLVQPLAARR
jgi:hypothetical protein